MPAKFYIGPATTANTLEAFQAISSNLFKEVIGVESIGKFGGTRKIYTHEPLDGGAVEKESGSINYGSSEVVMKRKPLDVGQIALMACVGSRFKYAFKIVPEDAEDANDTDSAFYGKAIVAAGTTEFSDATDKRSVTLEISGYMFEVPSTSVS
jgi:hypothetical protein